MKTKITRYEWCKLACFAAFLVMELALYITFLCMDVSMTGDSVVAKFSAVTLCMLFSFLYFGQPSAEKLLVSSAMIFTVLADVFLLVLDIMYEVGLIFFILAQVLYAIRLVVLTGWKWWVTTAVRASGIVIVWIVLACIGMFDLLNVLTAFYFVNLAVSAVEAWIYAIKRDRRMLLFAVGLTLFCACDICVGLNNSSIAFAMTDFVRVGMWAFYLPSQVLIVLSRFIKTDASADHSLREFEAEARGETIRADDQTAENAPEFHAELTAKESKNRK